MYYRMNFELSNQMFLLKINLVLIISRYDYFTKDIIKKENYMQYKFSLKISDY